MTLNMAKIPKLYYKFCVSCGKKDQPFEQKKWVSCIYCGIDSAVFRVELDHKDPRRTKRIDRDVAHLLTYKPLENADKTWRELQNVFHHELATGVYKGAENWNNLVSIKLTDKGKIVLGRSIS